VGFELTVVSAFRSFDRQAAIWNAKWRGQRPLYDRQGHPVAVPLLAGPERVHTILTWSAFPGASRHHWGTDLDVIDGAALPPGHRVELLPREFSADGPFYPMLQWLRANMARFGFFFPYRHDLGGVSPEPWHISYAPIAEPALQALTLKVLRDTLRPAGVDGADVLGALLPDLHRQYVTNISPPEPPSTVPFS
jgi:LAS superfamily LD-carboxypeptidase LdcB